MPKSSSKIKLKNMTDEQRVLYMEQKMLLEAEAKKKKEDLINELLKEKLHKEEKNTKVNLNKINYQWRAIMREAKSKDLQKDIEILSQTFERIIDRKDSVIKALVKDLQEAEEQYSMAMRSHFQNVDNLIDLHSEELDAARHKYQRLIEEIKIEFDKEREYILERHSHEMNELTMIIYGMEKNFLDQENEANIEFMSLRDELRSKHKDDKELLKNALDARINEKVQQYEQFKDNFFEMIRDRKQQYEELKAKDAESAKKIDQQMERIKSITDNINVLKAKIALNAKEMQETNNAIKENRDIMNAHFHDLKGQMKAMQESMRKKLTKLTIETNHCMEALKAKEEKAKRILKYAEMCRKLETEEEKILPFYASSLTNQEESEIKQALYENPGKELADVMRDYLSLENFWKRYNKVLLDKLSLDKQKQMLSTENAQLRVLIRQYLDGISVNSDVLANPNPLLIVNNRTNARIPVGNGQVERSGKVVIEAKDHLKNTIY